MRLETEQMAAVTGRADHRQGSHRQGSRLEVKTTATAKIEGSPMEALDLHEFLESIPANARVYVTPIMGGSQRDPECTGYTLTGEW